MERHLGHFTVKPHSAFFASPVDIIIPYYGQYASVQRCLDSIYRRTTTNPFRVILVDDASPCKDFLEQVGKQCPITPVRLESRVGFAGALAAGFAKVTCPWVVLMHSDVEVTTMDWLIGLGECMLRQKQANVRMALAGSDNPGVESNTLRPRQTSERVGDVVADEPLPLYCAMFHRELFHRIGGFLRTYPYAGYEDVELFYRMKSHGYGQAVCGTSWVKHYAGKTVTAVAESDKVAREEMELNRERCMADLAVLMRRVQ